MYLTDDWETDAPEAPPEPFRWPEIKECFRYAYGFGTGCIFAIALLMPADLCGYGWLGVLGAVIYWPTFERSLL